MISQPTERFSSRVENYVKYRPNYPAATLEVLRNHCGLRPVDRVADVGSGTGIFSQTLLGNGNRVFGVEPNAAMRAAAERWLGSDPHFTSVVGTAEATTLPDRCVSFVTVAQAFHWFDPRPALAEFTRILSPDGWVVLLWNIRRVDTTPFLRDYEQLLLTYGTDYQDVAQQHPGSSQIQELFGDRAVARFSLESHQHFDEEGLWGRLLSSSYAPSPEHPDFETMHRRTSEIFRRHQQQGRVSFDYDTLIYCVQI